MPLAARPILPRALAVLRVVTAAVLLAAGLTVVVPAQTYRMWLLSVGLIEFGHWLAPIALVLLWPGWHRNWSGRLAAAAGVLSAACLLSPVVRAFPVAQQVPARLAAAFGARVTRPSNEADATGRVRPLDAMDLFGGVAAPAVTAQRLGFVRRGERTLSLDLYAPGRSPDAPPVPIIVMVHGGGWTSGQPGDQPDLARYLAGHGFVVAAPEYRLAPEHRFPAAVDDLRAAIEFLRGRARTWGADVDGVVLIGRSAGGHLALLTAYTAPVNAVRGVVSLYGPADLRFGWEHRGNPRVYDGSAAIEAFLGGPPDAVPGAYVASSAYERVSASTPPTLLVHGRKDEVVWVEQSRRLAARLAEQRRPHLLVELPWATHGCDFTLSGPCGQITVYAVERFLAALTVQ